MSTRSKDRYLIDFWGGSHGHFLEYVVNCWIFDCPRVDCLFSYTGACHGAKADKQYQQESVILCNHFSQFDLEIQDLPEKIIRIIIDDFVGACCYQINVIHRAGDIPKKNKELASVPPQVLDNPAMLRNDYFAKLSSDQHAYDLPAQWKFQDVQSLHINMSLLYDFFSFMEVLKNIATFLNHKFTPDPELFYLWNDFMARNQGWKTWSSCHDVLKDVMANRDCAIDLEIEQQALLNLLLSRSVGIFDGDLFERFQYPLNTNEIYQQVKKHLDTFDVRF